MLSLESRIIKTKLVRKGILAYQYSNGMIIIGNDRHFFHSMTSAIQSWRLKHPIKKTK